MPNINYIFTLDIVFIGSEASVCDSDQQRLAMICEFIKPTIMAGIVGLDYIK